LRRRTQFFVWYLLARAHSTKIARLLPIVEKSFEHPWVAGVELGIRFWPGHASLARLRAWNRHHLPRPPMHWDAPVTVSVFRKRRGKRRQALCMSFYLVKSSLYIKQLQGVSGTDAPKEIRFWPKLFMEACRVFVRQEQLKEVKVPRADALYSYRNPFFNPQLLPEARERAVERIRRNMELLYDANALALGFVPDGAWFKWENPDSL